MHAVLLHVFGNGICLKQCEKIMITSFCDFSRKSEKCQNLRACREKSGK